MARHPTTGVNWFYLMLSATGLCIGFLLGRRSALPSRSDPQHKKAFVLTVVITFDKIEDRDDWLKHWATTAKYTAANEPNTLAYEALIADTDPKKIMIFERFVSKADFTEVHRATPAYYKFKEIRATLPYNATMQMHGQSYYQTNLGFIS